MWYNQTKQETTKYSCTVYTFLHLILLDFGVRIPDDMIIKFVYYLEKIWVLVLNKWASFSIIYPAMVKYVNWKYWVKLEVKTSSISAWLDDISAWSLWIKKLTTQGQKLWTSDWVFTKEDVDKSLTYKNAYGHNHWVKKGNKSDKWIIFDSWNGVNYECDLETLKYWVTKNLYFDTSRAIVAKDEFTKRLQKALIFKAKKKWDTLTIEEFNQVKYDIS